MKEPKGPFSIDSAGTIWRSIGQDFSHSCGTLPTDFDEAERDELVGLLNKGTHFDEMLEALQQIMDATENGAPDEGPRGRFANIVWRKASHAFAKAVGEPHR